MTQKWKTNQTMSKIHKPYINGKPKRPGTHQYHYLGPTVAVVAGKLDPTFDQLCFCRNFQTVRNLEKRTTEMSSEGPKMVERRYGLPKIAEKHKNPKTQVSGRRHLRRPDPDASGGGWQENFTGVVIWSSSSSLSSACIVVVAEIGSHG